MIFSGTAFASPGFVAESDGGPRTDALVFHKIIHTGPCPGTTLNPVRGHFFDQDVATAPGRRVRIVNVTPGMSTDPYPFTDRKYQNGDRSEKIDFLPRSEHGDRYFSVLEGLNDFEVTYLDGGRTVGSTTFQFPVVIETTQQTRWPVCRVENRCIPGANGGMICIPETVCMCEF
jgi:hypothetical protein